MRDLRTWAIITILVLSVIGCGKTETPDLESDAKVEVINSEENAQEPDENRFTRRETVAEDAGPDKFTRRDMEQRDTVEETETLLPINKTLQMGFSSGVGAWGTELELQPDGTFSGRYWDDEMGATGEGYPNGTQYREIFSGQFEDIVKVNDYTYSMKLYQLNIEKQEETIEDGVLYIPSEAYGISGGKNFLFYTKEAPMGELPEEFLEWGWLPAVINYEYQPTDLLGHFGLYNEDGMYGFYADDPQY